MGEFKVPFAETRFSRSAHPPRQLAHERRLFVHWLLGFLWKIDENIDFHDFPMFCGKSGTLTEHKKHMEVMKIHCFPSSVHPSTNFQRATSLRRAAFLSTGFLPAARAARSSSCRFIFRRSSLDLARESSRSGSAPRNL